MCNRSFTPRFEVRNVFTAPPFPGKSRRGKTPFPQTIIFATLFFSFAILAPVNAKEKASTTSVKTAIFAGGCFWCMEHPFDEVDGVISTTSGYTGGHKENPTYKQVSRGGTGHTEAVRVVYDPNKVSYERLLKIFWRNIDPLVKYRQFCDSGSQYRSGVFYTDEKQKRLAEKSKVALGKSDVLGGKILTEITAATHFYPAEDYHQDYYLKNPIRYKVYRYNCGRDKRLKELWGE